MKTINKRDSLRYPLSRILFPILLILVATQACNNPSGEIKTLQEDAAYLANLQCQAKVLQKERFALAQEKIRLEDSLLKFRNDPQVYSGLQERLVQFEPRAEDVWRRTKKMADSIQSVMDGYWEGTYSDTADRRMLDTALMEAFQMTCPDTLSIEEQ